MPRLIDDAERRQRILDAALDAFVEHGFVGATTDQVAAAATVSKQTIYRTFDDKEGLFRGLILDIGDRVDSPLVQLCEQVAETDDLMVAIDDLASEWIAVIMSPRVQRIRRLVIAEATRFPDLGKAYWDRGFARALNTVAGCFERLMDRGELRPADPMAAANHFAGLLLWVPSNRAMFHGTPKAVTQRDLDTARRDGVDAFLRAYAAQPM